MTISSPTAPSQSLFTYRDGDPRAWISASALATAIEYGADIPQHIVVLPFDENHRHLHLPNMALGDRVIELNEPGGPYLANIFIGDISAERVIAHRADTVQFFARGVKYLEAHDTRQLSGRDTGILHTLSCTRVEEVDICRAPAWTEFNPQFSALQRLHVRHAPLLYTSYTTTLLRVPTTQQEEDVMLVCDGHYLLHDRKGLVTEMLATQRATATAVREETEALTRELPYRLAEEAQELARMIDEALSRFGQEGERLIGNLKTTVAKTRAAEEILDQLTVASVFIASGPG